jgi:hypothetical protein
VFVPGLRRRSSCHFLDPDSTGFGVCVHRIFSVGLLYLLAALLMKVEPLREPKSSSEWEFYNSYASSKSLAFAWLKQRFERLDRRTRWLEDLVTGSTIWIVACGKAKSWSCQLG